MRCYAEALTFGSLLVLMKPGHVEVGAMLWLLYAFSHQQDVDLLYFLGGGP